MEVILKQDVPNLGYTNEKSMLNRAMQGII
jgi:ribosomal protein L9